MRLADLHARAIQRANLVAAVVYAVAALVLLPRFQRWPNTVTHDLASPDSRTFVERTLLDDPGAVWLAIPALLLLTNVVVLLFGDRELRWSSRSMRRDERLPADVRAHVRECRAQSVAWMGWTITTVSVFLSALLYAVREALVRRDATVFWSGLRFGVPSFALCVAVFCGLSGWALYRGQTASTRLPPPETMTERDPYRP